MKLGCLFSGGKDSTLALFRALQAGHEVRWLLSLFPEKPGAWMWHWPNAEICLKQAEAMGIEIRAEKTEVGENEELKALEKLVRPVSSEIQGLVTGAIASRYQYERIQAFCQRIGLELYAPLWQQSPELLWQELLDLGFAVIITSVSAEGLGKEWLGRIIDREALEELKGLCRKRSIHLSGEGGEFETLVLDGPIFKKALIIQKAEIEWDERSRTGNYLIKKVSLKPKPPLK
ncbi:MAG: diphthine--ammonia ligase [Candidatus Aenigmatarchaeota archaeon]|nr:MAG: diphthine--ammonia ligase [Candidatus Aenigmarchaeota archaeon]